MCVLCCVVLCLWECVRVCVCVYVCKCSVQSMKVFKSFVLLLMYRNIITLISYYLALFILIIFFIVTRDVLVQSVCFCF